MSAGKLVWYHVATHEWRDAPPKDGTWAMPYIQGRSPFSGLPHLTAVIDKLEAERAKLERDFREMEEDRDRLKSLHFSAALRIADLERELVAEREKAERYRLVTLRQDAELAALRKTLVDADVLYQYERDDGRREWANFATYIRKNEIVVLIDRAAFYAARKEAKP